MPRGCGNFAPSFPSTRADRAGAQTVGAASRRRELGGWLKTRFSRAGHMAAGGRPGSASVVGAMPERSVPSPAGRAHGCALPAQYGWTSPAGRAHGCARFSRAGHMAAGGRPGGTWVPFGPAAAAANQRLLKFTMDRTLGIAGATSRCRSSTPPSSVRLKPRRLPRPETLRGAHGGAARTRDAGTDGSTLPLVLYADWYDDQEDSDRLGRR